MIAFWAVVGLAAPAAVAIAVAADRTDRATPRGRPAPAGFTIDGRLGGELRPGVSRTVVLRLHNPHRWPITITRLSVALSVDAAHERAGCSRFANYRQVRLPARTYPLRLPAKSTRTLRQLGVTSAPRVLMLNLPVNQDACKGARLQLRFGGRSYRTGRPLAG